jgi:polysaccharide export outer membrane protein
MIRAIDNATRESGLVASRHLRAPMAIGRTLALLILSLAAGCHQGMYDASALPPGLAAQPVIDVATLDLSKIATVSENPSLIQPGDSLSVTVATGMEQRPQTWELTVSDDGTVDVPLVGSVPVSQHDISDAQQLVRQASIQRGMFRKPSVSVSLRERKKNRVTVMGAVEKPGAYEIPLTDSNLLAALVAAGGLTDDADTVVEVRQSRGQSRLNRSSDDPIATASYQGENGDVIASTMSQSQTIDLVAATMSGPAVANTVDRDYSLEDGAVIVVKQRPKRFIQVIGLVNRPNQFEIPAGKNLTVLDAIAMAHGLRINMADKVLVLRNTELSPQPVTIEVSLSEAKDDPTANILLTDGDIVSVEETPVTVALGAMKQFVRLSLRATDFY